MNRNIATKLSDCRETMSEQFVTKYGLPWPRQFAEARGSGEAELRCPKCKGNVIYKDTGKQYTCDECGECFNQERRPPLPNDKVSDSRREKP